jgi:sugar lactone lactonase YvrE
MKHLTPRLFVLDVSGDGRLYSVNPDGSGSTTLVTGARIPDGVAVDVEGGHIYWTNMGVPSANDGSVERVDLDGGNRTVIVPSGRTFTPKQLHLDPVRRQLYWGDREGMRVMRCNLDGSCLEVLVQAGDGDEDRRDETNWCVGVAVDHVGGYLYWTQKGPSDAGQGRILRAAIDVPADESAARRTDIEVVFKDLPEPIDLEIDHAARILYWTDRGDPPLGNTVNRAALDQIGSAAPEIVATHLMEGIGIALDPANDRMFVTDLAGTIYRSALDGSGHRPIRALQGNLTGIAYAEVPVGSAR